MKMERSFAVLLTVPVLFTLASCADSPDSTEYNSGVGRGKGGAAATETSGMGGSGGDSATGNGGSETSTAGAGGSDTTPPATGGSGGGGAGSGVTAPDAGGTPTMEGGVVGGAAMGKSSGCSKAPMGDKPGSYTQHHIMVSGIAATVKPAAAGGSFTNRVYYLDLPAEYNPETPYPVIFGGGGCGGAVGSNGNNGGFSVLPANNKLAIQIGLSYVWPEGGGACFSDNGADTPDLPYFDAIMKEIEANYCIDKGKVFVGGYSSGGWEAYMLGLARGGTVVRGISPAAGGLRMSRPTPSGLPIAALLLTGGNDTANPATGPTGSDLATDLILKTNKCTGTTTVDWPTCTNCGCVKYTGCPEAYPVIRCRPPGQGHTDGGGAFKTAIWSVWSTLP